MLRMLLRTGVRKGLFGGSKPWLVVGALAGGVRLLGRMATREPEVVYCEKLEPGQRVVISHLTETHR
ncbi:MAG: hypothetical protein M3O23_00120 [Actinomycetota bacterium]|nr:hypothetical protein [Actinomycetota bacterium]